MGKCRQLRSSWNCVQNGICLQMLLWEANEVHKHTYTGLSPASCPQWPQHTSVLLVHWWRYSPWHQFLFPTHTQKGVSDARYHGAMFHSLCFHQQELFFLNFSITFPFCCRLCNRTLDVSCNWCGAWPRQLLKCCLFSRDLLYIQMKNRLWGCFLLKKFNLKYQN